MKAMPRGSIQFVLVSVFILFAGTSYAQTSGVPRLDPQAEALRFAAEAAAGRTGSDLFLEAALWASGASGEAARTADARVRAAMAELAAMNLPQEAGPRAEKVLAFMHGRFLRRYEERQTRVDTLAVSGTYNCVSSAALYLILSASVGLEVAGVVTRDHAFCTVRTESGLVDVETTSPYGFDPGSRREFQDEFGRVTGFSYVPSRNYRDRSPIDGLDLVSLILSNRIVEAEASGRYGDAVEFAVDRRALLSLRREMGEALHFGDPRKELTDRLLNFGAGLARAAKEEEALNWAELIVGRFGPDPRWADFMHAALNNRVVGLLRLEQSAEARAALERRRAFLDSGALKELDRLVTDAELVSLVREIRDDGTAEAGYLHIAGAVERGALDGPRAAELRAFIALGRAERTAASGGYAAAVSVLDAAVQRFGPDKRLEEARRIYRSNRLAELHNRFAQLFNQGRHGEALAAAQEALREFPGEKRFLENEKLAERAVKTGSN